MSLFDELRCEYPLPDGFVPGDVWFQTEDTPEPYLMQYVLTAEGVLQRADTGMVEAFHGALQFYTTNLIGSSPWGCCTRDDAPPWWAEYCALFDHGTLLKLEGEKRPYTDQLHITRAAFDVGRRQR